MKRHLLTVLQYFGYFSYTPSDDEIYTFFPQKISKKNLKILLQKTSNHYPLITSHSLHTLPQYSIPSSPGHSREGGNPAYQSQFKKGNYRLDPPPLPAGRQVRGDDKIRRIQAYISILKYIPLVCFMGVTGASAMKGIRKNDDVDLCIVTKHTLLWTTRFFVVLLAKIMGIQNKNGVCLNLFFDESDLIIPRKKCNSYIAHELLQMKPVIDKDYVYQRFLGKNEWIYRYFPNAKTRIAKRKTLYVTRYAFSEHVDRLFKSLQLPIILRNQTAFSITPTQLWLFKNDFEKKLKRAGLVI